MLRIARPRPTTYVAACGIALIVAIAIGTTLTILDLRERALAHTQRELQNMALVLAAKTNSVFEIVERVQLSLREQIYALGIDSAEDFEQKMSGYDRHLILKDKRLGLPHVGSFTLINAQGKLFNFSRFWPIPDVDVSDRDFFKAFQSTQGRTFFISDPIRNRATGTWVIQLVRKITATNGEFAGLLLATVELEHLAREFQTVVLGDYGSISLIRNDGVLLARFPGNDAFVGQTFTGAADQLRGREHGTVRLIGRMDNKDRLLAAHRLSGYPFFVSVGADVEAALSGWHKEVQFLIGIGLVSAIFVAIVTFFVVRQLVHRRRQLQQEIEAQKLQLNVAINNMSQGLLMFDSSERIVVCNNRYLEIYGLSPDVIKPGCTFRELIRHRKEAGGLVGDADDYYRSIMDEIAQGKTAFSVIDVADGRAVRVVNQPMAGGGWVATHEDITELKRADERIAHLAHYDALTDLPNRILFRKRLEQSLKWIRRGDNLAMLYLDLDHFKSVNDTLGHPVGDELLKAVAGRLRECLKDEDTVARLGGDEFAIIQGAVTRPADVVTLVTRIYEAIRRPYDVGGHQLVTDTSIGVALAPVDGTDPDQLLKNADLAMYRAKADGRGTYRFFEPDMDSRVKARRALEFDLREAIMGGGFELHYQPVVNLWGERVCGCEGLLRWRHRERGMIPPAEFIPLAEETGLISPLGEWILRTACADARAWPEDVKIAINISPVQFKSGNLVQTVINCLAASELPPQRLELEITEAVLINDDEAALTVLKQLRELGVQIAMDDFGTGYSSLSYLQRFPFDKIKIDRSFIKTLTEIDGSFSIVRAVIDIATERGIATTAEGVETEQQLKVLRALGCTEMQGYLFSPPRPAADILQLLFTSRERIARIA